MTAPEGWPRVRIRPERRRSLYSAQPDDVGLYRAENEHDACGVALVATMRGSAGHDIIEHALTALRNLDHRGATGADPLVGDGAGLLSQMPDAFLRDVVGFRLPGTGAYAVGLAFLPVDEAERAATVEAIQRIAAEESLEVLGWREVPVAADIIGEVARDCMPHFAQLFVTGRSDGPAAGLTGIALDRYAYCLRKRAELET
ncbi:MAG TPA: glutamate synthase subunit alpha, partial [Lapillicoccus sp.]